MRRLFNKWSGTFLSVVLMAVLMPAFTLPDHFLPRSAALSRAIETPLPAVVRDSVKMVFDPKMVFSIAAVGDVMMEGTALPVIREKGPDYPFAATKPLFDGADMAVANLEAPFGTGGRPFAKTFTFRVPPEFGVGIRNAGFDVLTLANNHILDYGPSELGSTLALLDSLKLAHCGAGWNSTEAEKEAVFKKSGWTVAVLAYSLTYPEAFWATASRCGTAFPRKETLKRRIADIRSSADLVVVCFHWGQELASVPQWYQQEFARLSIDSGADLVIGHHPHVLQGLELYKGKPIAYSLGNFVFGSNSESCRDSAVLKAFFTKNGFHHAEVVPISVYHREVRFQPRILEGERRDRVIRFINSISKNLNRGRELVSSDGVVVPDGSTAHEKRTVFAESDSIGSRNR
jgi:poly-gamma-glutamate synthesis protein (capsule biosynthesis protein)